MAKIYKINGNEYEVSINSLIGNHAEVNVNGVLYQVEISDKASYASPAVKTVKTVSQPISKTPAVSPAGAKKSIKAPLPGVIVSLKVQPGDSVKPGQTVAVLEAMKMENDIQSEFSGVILSVEVNPGDSILEGTTIVTVG